MRFLFGRFWTADLSPAQKKIRRASDQRRPIHPRKNANVQKSVARVCGWKDFERSTVKFSVANQNQFTGLTGAIRRGLHLRLFSTKE
jgi:hypothetical protein